MLGLGQSSSHGGAPDTTFKLGIQRAVLQDRPNDASFSIRCGLLDDGTREQIGQPTQGAYTRYTALTADVTINRVNTDTGAVISTATATLNVYKPGSSSSNIFLTDATGDSSEEDLQDDNGDDTLNLADTNVFSSDISTSDEAQAFRVDVILKGTGFLDSDSISSAALGTSLSISA
jgi:hypothetical protein